MKKSLISSMLLSAGVLLMPAALAESDFDAFKRGFAEYQAEQAEDFENYQQVFQEEFENYKQEVLKYWSDPQMTGRKQWVEYDADLQARRVVDYEANTIEVTLIVEVEDLGEGTLPSMNPDALPEIVQEELQAQLELLLNETVEQAHDSDPVEQAVRDRLDTEVTGEETDGDSSGEHLEQVVLSELQEEGETAEQIAQNLSQQAEVTTRPANRVDARYVTLTVELPADRPMTKAREYQEFVLKTAEKWELDSALVMAIMHTESHFNPMARSHIPAYGLMQVVPNSAGKDATKLIYGEMRVLGSDYLFTPENNINVGSAYLHILFYRYMKHVTDPESRMYCTIAAYNTGSGNVARAFTGERNMRKASAVVNTMTPEEVYQHLIEFLPYEETRSYVQKVVSREQSYQSL